MAEKKKSSHICVHHNQYSEKTGYKYWSRNEQIISNNYEELKMKYLILNSCVYPLKALAAETNRRILEGVPADSQGELQTH